MKLFNEKAAHAIASAHEYDATYCTKMAKRLKAMGICAETTSDAVCTLVEKEAVPQVGVWASNPGILKSIFKFSVCKG